MKPILFIQKFQLLINIIRSIILKAATCIEYALFSFLIIYVGVVCSNSLAFFPFMHCWTSLVTTVTFYNMLSVLCSSCVIITVCVVIKSQCVVVG